MYVKGFFFFCFCFGPLLLDSNCQGMRQDLTRMGSGQIHMFRRDGSWADSHVQDVWDRSRYTCLRGMGPGQIHLFRTYGTGTDPHV